MTCAISRAVLDRLMEEAREAGAEEICGLLLASGGLIDTAAAIPNNAANPRRGFELDPRAHLAAARAARVMGKTVRGHYHSHPSGDPRPSPADAASADEDGRYWLIVTRSAARMWVSTKGGSVLGAFEPIQLDAV